jgi:hypothetical protein
MWDEAHFETEGRFTKQETILSCVTVCVTGHFFILRKAQLNPLKTKLV